LSVNRETAKQSSNLWVDVGPVIVFVFAYNGARWAGAEGRTGWIGEAFDKGDAIFWATGAYMVAMVAALATAWVQQKRVPPMLVATSVIVLVFGALTIGLQSPLFAYIKPTIINGLFALAIGGAMLFGLNIWKFFFGEVFTLPDRIWNVLAWRWAGWFVFLAILNEVIWRTMSEDFWANFKLFGVIPLTFLFALANVPITLKWSGRSNADFEAGNSNAASGKDSDAA